MMTWSIETDDFMGLYSDRPYPLLHAMNEILESGEIYDPSTNTQCGSGPMCDIGEEPNLPGNCEILNETLPYPGDCHRYYRCIRGTEGAEFDVQILSCGKDVFDPFTKSCISADLDAALDLCNEAQMS